VAGVGSIPGFEKFEVAGGGYINVRVNRAEVAAELAADRAPVAEVPAGKVLVEHSSINPNKAAHIGHLRNAFWATRLSGCCAWRAGKWTSRITSTTRERRLPMWWLDSCTLKRSPC